ncbi:MAG: C40 family peptidase [Lachnospiraceae bacterium]|nr:C40 family peptidase [Lachnospiraceae bacterium]
MKNGFKRFVSTMIVLLMLAVVVESADATTISDIQKEKEKNEELLKEVNEQIADYKGAQADIGSEIEELDAELVSLLTDINLIEEEISSKEEEIVQTQADYDAAVETKDAQYESMKIRIKFMYEQGDISYMQLLLTSSDIGDALNKAEYIEKLYEYDRKLLEEYQVTVETVAALQEKLEDEKSELQTSKFELEEEQTYAQELLAQKQEEYDNYDVILAQAKQEAAAYTTKIKQETAQIKKLEEEARRKAEEEEAKRKAEEEAKRKAEEEARRKSEEEAGSKSEETQKKPETSTPVVASYGSASGREIAEFACKWIGNPYVAGGTSLTNGADCSGFVQSVYKEYGYNLPRTSYSQSQVGRSVPYSEAEPGDIIYYGGHVAIYIGNGQIVHAATARTGIVTQSATYRSIITVRRIVS